jgi:hypothetical protein
MSLFSIKQRHCSRSLDRRAQFRGDLPGLFRHIKSPETNLHVDQESGACAWLWNFFMNPQPFSSQRSVIFEVLGAGVFRVITHCPEIRLFHR